MICFWVFGPAQVADGVEHGLWLSAHSFGHAVFIPSGRSSGETHHHCGAYNQASNGCAG